MVHSQFEPGENPDAGLAAWRKAMDAQAAQRLLDVTLTGIPTQRPPGKAVPDLRMRDHLMVRLMMEAGPRVSELVAFNLTDLTTRTIGGRTERFLQIQHGKGRKARSAPLSPATWEVYQDYVGAPRGAGSCTRR